MSSIKISMKKDLFLTQIHIFQIWACIPSSIPFLLKKSSLAKCIISIYTPLLNTAFLANTRILITTLQKLLLDCKGCKAGKERKMLWDTENEVVTTFFFFPLNFRRRTHANTLEEAHTTLFLRRKMIAFILKRIVSLSAWQTLGKK